MQKPKQGDYLPYYEKYIELVPEGDVPGQLRQQLEETVGLFGKLTEAQAAYRYGEGKWSLKELLGHVTDTERIMTYRLLCVARGETASLPGFDENIYVAGADFGRRPLAQLLNEFKAVRAATVGLLEGLSDEALDRVGTANGARISARALAYIVAGHAMHHMTVVRERYLPGLPQ